MKLLVDSCVSNKVVEDLVRAGHDAEWVGGWPADPGDEEVLAAAVEQERVLITIDKDFGERTILRGEPHRGLVRLVDIATADQAARCLDVLARYESELLARAIIVVEPGRIRIRTAT